MIRGVFAPIATPFKADDSTIYWDKLKLNLDKWSKSGLAGLVVLGSNSEFQLLSRQKRRTNRFCTREHKERRSLPVPGVNLLKKPLNFLKAADLGADAVLVVTLTTTKLIPAA